MVTIPKDKTCFLEGAVFFALIAGLTFPPAGEAVSSREAVRQGNHLYAEGKFSDSLRMYEKVLEKDPGLDIAHFNAGTALYKQKRYDDAVDHFQKSLLSDDAVTQERAHYNLGNAFYKAGIGKEKADIAAAIASLEESLKHFGGALALDKRDKDAQYNYDYVTKELERLRKEQQKQQQSGQKGQQDKKEGQNQQPSRKEQSADQQAQGQSKTEDRSQSQPAGAQPQKQQDQGQNSAQQSSADESPDKQPLTGNSAGETQKTESQKQQQQEGAASTGAAQGQELTKSEAERLLQNYQQTEEPQGLLHVFQQKHETGAVIKDW